jgi:hypothetical protein
VNERDVKAEAGAPGLRWSLRVSQSPIRDDPRVAERDGIYAADGLRRTARRRFGEPRAGDNAGRDVDERRAMGVEPESRFTCGSIRSMDAMPVV